tara:strand:+ start:300 stop:677 length:378 start_codon:yes stop_codon:yes gene_type:complete
VTIETIQIIGRKQNKRKNSFLSELNEVKELISILNSDYSVWSDFDSWENMKAQQWVFSLAMKIYNGKNIDLRCNCCDYSYVLSKDFKNRLDDKCIAIKAAYVIEKIVDEIIMAKAKRDSDGTYLT